MMPSISFSTMKAKLLSGEKKQTIRPYRTDWWTRWEEGDRLVGYWMMRTKQCEKLFDSRFSEDPLIIIVNDIKRDEELARRDGFDSCQQAWDEWFFPHYGNTVWEYVVLRWL